MVLESECPSVADLYGNISRSIDMSVSKILVILHNAPCFHQVFAYDIDVNHTISTISINGNFNQSLYTGDGMFTVDNSKLECMHAHEYNICSSLKS